ncbi:MAG: 50S ribosomal protein L23 [Microgenomates group bacterium]
MEINEILIEPILTEKSTNLAKENIYVIKVNKKANKFQIKEAIEKLYKVKVAKVMIKNIKGKTKKVGRRRIEKKLPAVKIAYIKLKEGSLQFLPKA